MHINDCYLMPQMGNGPLYFAMFPVNTDRFTVEGKTMMQRIADYYSSMVKDQGESLTDEDIEILAQWICYYWHAPCWLGAGGLPREIMESCAQLEPTLDSIHRHLMTCIDHSLDPF